MGRFFHLWTFAIVKMHLMPRLPKEKEGDLSKDIVMNIFDKILYGIKVANDNIIIINDKVDAIMKMLSYDEQKEQDDASPMTDGKQ